jgi:hypothetical protein
MLAVAHSPLERGLGCVSKCNKNIYTIISQAPIKIGLRNSNNGKEVIEGNGGKKSKI